MGGVQTPLRRPPARPSRGTGGKYAPSAAISSSCVPCSTIVAVLEHDDAPGLADGREPVGDHDRRAAGQQPPQAALDPALGVDVDVRGGLVEHEDARVGDQRAREGDELALAGRELHAALAHLGVVAVLELA